MTQHFVKHDDSENPYVMASITSCCNNTIITRDSIIIIVTVSSSGPLTLILNVCKYNK